MLNKPKFNLPNRESRIHFPRCQFQVVPRCLMSTLEEKVVFKERTEYLLNIRNFIQRFKTYVREQYLQVLRTENIHPTVCPMRWFVHHSTANISKVGLVLQERTKFNQTLLYLPEVLGESTRSIMLTLAEQNSLGFQQLPSTSPSRGQLKKPSKQLGDQQRWWESHLHDNRLEIGQSFQVSCEFKLNEGMTLLLKLSLLFWICKRFFMSQSGLTVSGYAQATLSFLLY